MSSGSAAPHLIARVDQIHDRSGQDHGFSILRLFPRAREFGHVIDADKPQGAAMHNINTCLLMRGALADAAVNEEFLARKLLASNAQEPFPFALFR